MSDETTVPAHHDAQLTFSAAPEGAGEASILIQAEGISRDDAASLQEALARDNEEDFRPSVEWTGASPGGYTVRRTVHVATARLLVEDAESSLPLSGAVLVLTITDQSPGDEESLRDAIVHAAPLSTEPCLEWLREVRGPDGERAGTALMTRKITGVVWHPRGESPAQEEIAYCGKAGRNHPGAKLMMCNKPPGHEGSCSWSPRAISEDAVALMKPAGTSSYCLEEGTRIMGGRPVRCVWFTGHPGQHSWQMSPAAGRPPAWPQADIETGHPYPQLKLCWAEGRREGDKTDSKCVFLEGHEGRHLWEFSMEELLAEAAPALPVIEKIYCGEQGERTLRCSFVPGHQGRHSWASPAETLTPTPPGPSQGEPERYCMEEGTSSITGGRKVGCSKIPGHDGLHSWETLLDALPKTLGHVPMTTAIPDDGWGHLALHLADKHADPVAVQRGLRENIEQHAHEHAGPGTIRNHPLDSREFAISGAWKAIMEMIESDGPWLGTAGTPAATPPADSEPYRPHKVTGCPDGGVCGHWCGEGPCFRVQCCGPFSNMYPGDRWPDEILAANDVHRPVETPAGGAGGSAPWSPEQVQETLGDNWHVLRRADGTPGNLVATIGDDQVVAMASDPRLAAAIAERHNTMLQEKAACTDAADLMPDTLNKVVVIAAAMMKSTVGHVRAKGAQILPIVRDARRELSRHQVISQDLTALAARWTAAAKRIREDPDLLTAEESSRAHLLGALAEELRFVMQRSYDRSEADLAMVPLRREDVELFAALWQAPAGEIRAAIERAKEAL